LLYSLFIHNDLIKHSYFSVFKYSILSISIILNLTRLNNVSLELINKNKIFVTYSLIYTNKVCEQFKWIVFVT